MGKHVCHDMQMSLCKGSFYGIILVYGYVGTGDSILVVRCACHMLLNTNFYFLRWGLFIEPEAISASWATIQQSPGMLLLPPPYVGIVGAVTMPGSDVMLGIWALLLLFGQHVTLRANSLDPTVGLCHGSPRWILLLWVLRHLGVLLCVFICIILPLQNPKENPYSKYI